MRKTVSLFVGILVSVLVGCKPQHSETPEFDYGGIERFEPEAYEKLKSLFAAAKEGNESLLFESLPNEFSRYKTTLDPTWKLLEIELRNLRSNSEHFMYVMYQSTEELDGKRYESEGVLMLSHDSGEWELMNFPFWRSEIPEFDSPNPFTK